MLPLGFRPSLGQMVVAWPAEESTELATAYRPEAALCDEEAGGLAAVFAESRGAIGWSDHAALARDLLGDDPVGIAEAIKKAVEYGASSY